MDVLDQNMRMIARFRKGESLKYISHLDVQRTLQRALRRACIPVAYSNGFNPHIQLSFATALGTGIISEAEWFDTELSSQISPTDFLQKLQKTLPEDLMVLEAFYAPIDFGTLSSHTRSAEYSVSVEWDMEIDFDIFQEKLERMLSDKIIVQKRTKGGIRPVDIRPQILNVSVKEIIGNHTDLNILGRLQTDGGLRVTHFLEALSEFIESKYQAEIIRNIVYFESDGLLPQIPDFNLEE